jgi:hypothetical protein
LRKPKSINELFAAGDSTLGALQAQTRARSRVVEQVWAALPPPLARAVVSAGIEQGRLTIGVAGGTWASRLRYATDTLRARVGEALGVDIHSIRIKVVPPRA